MSLNIQNNVTMPQNQMAFKGSKKQTIKKAYDKVYKYVLTSSLMRPISIKCSSIEEANKFRAAKYCGGLRNIIADFFMNQCRKSANKKLDLLK